MMWRNVKIYMMFRVSYMDSKVYDREIIDPLEK